MIRTLIFTAALALVAFSGARAQSVITILHFDKNSGIIDRGEEDGIRVGDVFEVNRYSGDYVYWVGRVEVILVKPKMAGVKLVDQARNSTIQQGDLLELRQRKLDPLFDKLDQSGGSGRAEASRAASQHEMGSISGQSLVVSAPRSKRPVQIGFSTGLAQPVKRSSESLGLGMVLQIVQGNQVIERIDMTRAYTTSFDLQASAALPISRRFSLGLRVDYVPLNIKDGVQASLLDVGLQASGSLMRISTTMNYRLSPRLQAGLGFGLYLPKVTVSGGEEKLTVSDRFFGVGANTAYLLPLGSRVWLKSVIEYNAFKADEDIVGYLSIHTGPSIAIGN